MSRSHKEIEQAFDDQKESDYELIKEAGFDSEEIWDLWYDCDEDITCFIESLNKLESDALYRIDEMEDADDLG
jgi:hypothetical protein